MINPGVQPAPQELQDKHYYENMALMLTMDRGNNTGESDDKSGIF